MSSMGKYRVSVVLNTCNRGAFIGDTLEGLKQQTYDNFEVIVVNGPSFDNTEKVVKQYHIRYYTAPYNISVSRNVGIAHAAGEIIAFIDDDAVPEPRWLEDLVKAYDDPKVGAAGGLVYNHNGSEFQFCYGMIDMWGYPQLRQDKPYDFNEPRAEHYNINIGTNASYRRKPLIEIGGFDEEIEYYHDESDVCVRMVNHGFKVAQLGNAYVHHKMAPSSRRDDSKTVTNWDAIVKNSIYFAIKHTQGLAPLNRRLITPFVKESKKFPVMLRDLFKGQYNPWQYIVRNISLIRAIYRGYKRGFSANRKMLKGYKYRPEDFLLYKKSSDLVDGSAKDIILITQGYPPTNTDGISRYNNTLAKELANRGHRVYVVTKNIQKGNNIFYRDKHWIYFHDPSSYKEPVTGFERTDSVLALSKSAYATAKGISEKIKIDLVLAPLWDVEGIALIRHKIAPTVLTLMSPLKKVVETQWYWLEDPSLEIMYELEKYCIENADGVMAISNAIKKTIGKDYAINWKEIEKKKLVEVLPLGVDESFLKNAATGPSKDKPKDKVKLLFVGRFEKRKGIDLLLTALPGLLMSNKDLEVHLVGNSNILDEDKVNLYSAFTKANKSKPWFNQIIKHGYVTDEELAELYKNCDVFVAPSRYESFGLIFIEAMAFGKPLVGADVGGIPEILKDGKNGLLFEPGNAKDLEDKLSRLISDEKLRTQMGIESRLILEDKFSSSKMGKKFINMLEEITS
jgi:glycogen(starch) synthase